MSHSLRSYLQRRSTEELEGILQLYQDDMTSELNKEVVRLTIQALSERGICRFSECLAEIGETDRR